MERPFLWILVLALLAVGTAAATPPNWGGSYAPCLRNQDLLQPDRMSLGVRISTSNAVLAREFARALDFWRQVVELDWERVDSGNCSVHVVDGEPELFPSVGTAARAHSPDRAEFQGWVAFNPASKLTAEELFAVSVHEIGHLLGLAHNPSCNSVMYFLGLDGPLVLDAADLSMLAKRHPLKSGLLAAKGKAMVRVQ